MADTASPTSQKITHPAGMSDADIARARELFQRHPANPILQPKDMPFPCKSVCNPGVCRFEGDVLLLLRVIGDDDRSHLYVARSQDGVTDWRIEPTPLLSPDIDARWYDDQACEDPRITYLEDREEWIIAYVGVSRFGAGVCLASTKDFQTVTRLGMAIHPYNKDAALLPRRINGTYRLLHRPTAGPLENIWMSESEDLIHWGNPCCVLEEQDQPGWDSGKVGTGPPPFEGEGGWVLIFHGVMRVNDAWEYPLRPGPAGQRRPDPNHLPLARVGLRPRRPLRDARRQPRHRFSHRGPGHGQHPVGLLWGPPTHASPSPRPIGNCCAHSARRWRRTFKPAWDGDVS